MQIRIEKMEEKIKDFCVKNKEKIGIIYFIVFALTLIAQIYFLCFSWISIIREIASFIMLLIALIPSRSIFHQEKQYGGIFNVGYEYGKFLFDFIKNISNITNDERQRTSNCTKNKICKFHNINKLYFNSSSDDYVEMEKSMELQIKLDDFEFFKQALLEDKIISKFRDAKPNKVEFIYELNALEIYKVVKNMSMFEHYIEDRLK